MSRRIAIVGGGFSGALTTVQLLRQGAGRNDRITLIERKGTFGRGLAYGTWDDNLLLNVPAGNMSALDADPGHFLRYCQSIDPHFNSGSFLPRRIYGDYMEDLLNDTRDASRAPVQRLTGEAIAIRRDSRQAPWLIKLAGGEEIPADAVILALGHSPPRPPDVLAQLPDAAPLVANPWDPAALERTGKDGTVVLLGSGHTAIDTLFRVTSVSDRTWVVLVSRHGLLPRSHRIVPKAPVPSGFPEYLAEHALRNARACVLTVRREMRRRIEAGGDWRDVINELRPHVAQLWRQWAPDQRRRFLERIRAYWDVHRHRLAPSAHMRLARLLESGRARILAAQLGAARWDGEQIVLSLRRRPDGQTVELAAKAVVNCMGPDYRVKSWTSPLARQLCADGLLCHDPLELGVQVDDQYRLLDRSGAPTAGLFYVGPMLRAEYWEATAVPELRVHADRLAARVLALTLASSAAGNGKSGD
jgi:uncharacterized NAD(P)/FAD-binding protein YdhS